MLIFIVLTSCITIKHDQRDVSFAWAFSLKKFVKPLCIIAKLPYDACLKYRSISQ